MPERFKVVCIPYKALYKCSLLSLFRFFIRDIRTTIVNLHTVRHSTVSHKLEHNIVSFRPSYSYKIFLTRQCVTRLQYGLQTAIKPVLLPITYMFSLFLGGTVGPNAR